MFDSYIKKMLKITDFVNFVLKYIGPQIFTRHSVCGGKEI